MHKITQNTHTLDRKSSEKCAKNFIQECLSTPKSKGNKGKTNNWDYSKLKGLCTANETINKMKRQPTEWEKIFTNHISDKGLISKIYKEFIKLKAKKQTIPFKIGQKN